MNVLLVLECSTPRASVAVVTREGVIFERRFDAARGRTSLLFGELEAAAAHFGEVDTVVVGLGPGSYAGVRASLAAASGMSMARGWKMAGVISLEGLGDVNHAEYLAAGDARKSSFYFAPVRNGSCVETPVLLTREELETRIATASRIPVLVPAPIDFLAQAQVAFPDAATLGRQILQGRTPLIEGTALEPLYLRDPHITVARTV